MSDYYIDELQDYIEVLCQDHKQVNHNMLDTTDGQVYRSFARFESEEHIRNIQNKGGDCIVVFADYYGQRVLHQDDDRTKNTIVIRFAKKAAAGTASLTNARNEAARIAMDVMFDFINRMTNDAVDEMCEELRDLEISQATWQPIDDQPWLDDYYGWDLSIPYLGFMPAYDGAKWRTDGTELPVDPAPPGGSASDGKYQKILEFKVGAAGAPMVGGDTLLTDSRFENKYVQVFANGIKLHEFVTGMTIERYITKVKAENFITFTGGVIANEIIAVYTFEVE